MNVFEITQSFQSVVETISTTNPTDQYVSKDLFQTCMASFANNIIELTQSVNQLSWGLRTEVQTLSNKLDSLEGTTEILQTNYSNILEKITSLYSNNIKVLNSLKQLSDRVENTEKINKQNVTMLFDRINKLETSNSNIQGNIKDISDRLHIAESNITTSHQTHKTTVEWSDKISEVCYSVDELHNYSSMLLGSYKSQQASLESLKSTVNSLQEKSDQIISHSTPKPPPGIPHRNISHSPFFLPKTPPGFETIFTPHSSTLDMSQQLDIMKLGNNSPSVKHFEDTVLSPEMPVSQTDRDGAADSHQVSAAPSKSITVSHTDSVATQGPSVTNQITILSSEAEIISHSNDSSNQSVDLSHRVSVPSTSCQSVCDSGIVSILDETSQLPCPIHTDSSCSDEGKTNPDHFTQITPTSEISQIETVDEGKGISISASQSGVMNSAYSTVNNITPILNPGLTSPSSSNVTCVTSEPTVEGCGEAITVLTVVPCGHSEQSAGSPVKSFEQVVQSEGHTEYGKLHPVRRPWQLLYLTLRWLKPFK